jgi:hypothetical protein
MERPKSTTFIDITVGKMRFFLSFCTVFTFLSISFPFNLSFYLSFLSSKIFEIFTQTLSSYNPPSVTLKI